MTTLFQTKIINSYIIKLFLSFCLLAFSYISPILAQKDSVNSSNYLLIINSYTEAAPWSFRMISAITEYAQNSPQLALYTEHMNMLMMDTDSTLNEFRQRGIQVFRTDEQGTIEAVTDGVTIKWNCSPSETWKTGN